MPILYPIANLLAGAFATFAFAPYGYYEVAFIITAIALFIWTRLEPRRALLYGYIFGYAYSLGSVYWVYYSLYDYGQAHPLFAGVAVLLFAAFIAIYYAVLAWLIAHSAKRFSLPAVYFLISPSLWILFEWSRSFSAVGFPWNLLGQALIDSPLSGVFPIIGIYGASFLIVFCSASGVYILSSSGVRQRIAMIVGVVIVISGALSLQNLEWTYPRGKPVSFALIQANITQAIKFDRAYVTKIIDTYQTATLENLDKDLIVWPETALPMFSDTAEHIVFEELRTELDSAQSDLLAGVFYRDGNTQYNSLLNVRDRQIYHKRSLVPFGEYIPLRSLLNIFQNFIVMPMSNLHSGQNRPLLSLGKHNVGVSICYESAFSSDIIDSLPEAEYLVNVSNDSWFGLSNAPFQLLQMARIRSAEVGRSTLRATSTGISAHIDWHGRITQMSRVFEKQTLSGEIQPRAGITPYARFGSIPVLVIAVILIILVLITQRNIRLNDTK